MKQKRTKLICMKQVKIPTLRFVVFYNGTDFQPEQQILHLSDAFEKKLEHPLLELTVVVYNINFGHNPELLEALSDFLSKNRAEVIAVSIFEYDEEKHIMSEREEWREIGREEGFKTGLDNLSLMLKSLMDTGKTEALQRALSDSAYREQLYREYFSKSE